jgi:acetoin:2,6-dichlorophenolindophenol oxidoreductase subunit beta
MTAVTAPAGHVSFSAAIERALDHAMATDPRVIVFGEDVELTRRNQLARFGPARVRNTPISEAAFVGAAVGAAMAGLRPIVELWMIDFVTVALDALMNHAAKVATFSGGAWDVPLVVRAPCGGGYGDAGQHEQALWGLLAGIPGLTVVVPSTPADAAGLLLSAVASDGPVVFLEHKLLAQDLLEPLGRGGRDGLDFDVPADGAWGPVGAPPTPVPIGVARTRRAGADVTLVSVGVGVHRSLAAAEALASVGIDAGVLDLRTVAPLDTTAVLDAAGRTGAIVVVDEDYAHFGLSGEIAAVVAEAGVPCRYARVATAGTLPYARSLEAAALPTVARIVAAGRRVAHP